MSKSNKKKSPALSQADFMRIVTSIHEAIDSDLGGLIAEQRHNPEQLFYYGVQNEKFTKKFCVPGLEDRDKLELEAFLGFLDINEEICSVNRSLLDLPQSCPGRGFNIRRILNCMRSIIASILGSLDTEKFHSFCKHSNGASVGLSFANANLLTKNTWPLTGTHRAVQYFDRIYLKDDKTMNSCIKSHNERNPVRSPYRIVDGSVATTVDKSLDERRMIAKEPTVNMFLQQGLMDYMYAQLKPYLDLECLQDVHKRLAAEASLTRLFATIDFSKASDRVAYALVKETFPPDWFMALDMCRSPNICIDGEWHVLNMFSTMGNATTFPIETLVLYSLALAIVSSNRTGAWWEHTHLVSVYGDDSIVPTTDALYFMGAAECIGFKVNKTKSFYTSTEKFRESCGGDYLSGRNVRPYYIQAPLNLKISSLGPWLVTVANRLLKKYISYFGVTTYCYYSVFQVIDSWFARYQIRPFLVPSHYSEDSGLFGVSDPRIAKVFSQCMRRDAHSDIHGTHYFHYWRFVWPEGYTLKFKHDKSLDYWMALKFPSTWDSLGSLPSVESKYKKRIMGGYVVAKGSSFVWN